MRLTVAFLATLFLCTSTTRADDWPQWLGKNRDGATSEVVGPWKEPLKVLWKNPVGEGHGGPIVVKNVAYLFYRPAGKNEEAVVAVDAVKGTAIWTKSYPRKETKILFGNGPRGAPCLADGKLYTFGITSILTCFDAADGKIVWQVDCEKEYKAPTLFFGSSCSPIVVGDHVLVNIGAKGASIVAFDKITGKEVWKKLDDPASYSSPLLYKHGDSERVAFLTGKGLVSLAPKDGTVHWQYPFVDKLFESSCTPVLVNGNLLASSITAGSILVKETNEPKPANVWSNALNCYFATPVVVGPDTIYLVTGSNPLLGKKATAMLRCVDAKTGKEIWNRPNVGTYHATLIRTGNDKLLMLEEKGDLVLFDPNPKAYTELSRGNICGKTWAHPAISDGRLFIRDATNFICVELPK